MRKTAENTELSIEHILTAAEEVFCCHGYFSATMDDIAQKAGLSKGAIFWHFQSKAGLFKVLAKRATDRLMTIFTEEFSVSGHIIEKYRRILVRIHKDRSFQILLIIGEIQAKGDNELISESLQDISAIFHTGLHHLEQAQQQGELTPDINVADVLVPIVLTLTGFSRIRELRSILGPFAEDIDGEKVINSIFSGLNTFKEGTSG